MAGSQHPSPIDRRFEEAAVDLAERGYFVLPCRPRGKEPLTPHGFHDATRDERTIRQWWDRWPDANIGIACGPSGIAVLDIDSKHGADPREVIPDLGLDDLPTVLTGEAPERSDEYPNSLPGVRGAHVLFRSNLPTGKTIIPGVEIRGAGAYVLAPPSVHPSGVPYEGEYLPVGGLRDAIHVGLDLIAAPASTSTKAPDDDEPIEQGDRHDALLAWARSRYTAKGVLGQAALDGMRGHNARCCQPPLPDDEVERLWRHLEQTRIAESERAKAAAEVEPPATGALLQAVVDFVARFVVLPSPACARAVALFVLHTWAFEAAHATPYLVVESPEKKSGKTRLLEVLDLICRDAYRVSSITAAGLFQTIGQDKPTLLIDEADAVFAGNAERNEDLRGVLNAGNAPGSKVIRGGKDGKPVHYAVYCPKVIAGIATGKLPDTIRDRAIVIPIDRKLRSERVERLRRRRLQDEIDALRAQLGAWAQRHRDRLVEYDLPEPVEAIDDRLEEAWEPLLAIADLAGGEWPEGARAAATDLAGDGEHEATHSLRLLLAMRDAFGGSDVIATADALTSIKADEQLPFASWNDGTGMTPYQLGKLLGRYRIHPDKVWLPHRQKSLQGYRREWFFEAWERYGGANSGKSGRTAPQSQIPGIEVRKDEAAPSGLEEAENPHGARDLPDLPENGRHTWTDDDFERLAADYGSGLNAEDGEA